MDALIAKCTCKSEFQDQLYGKGMRYFNRTEDGKGGRCTVCGACYGTAHPKKSK
jgi:hypothetical protein